MQTNSLPGGTFALDDIAVNRVGYGAMQLASPHVFGPPADRDEAVRVLREATRLGVDHIDTSDFYGPHMTNEIIKEALHPYPESLTIVTKVGAKRDAEGCWPHARSPRELLASAPTPSSRSPRHARSRRSSASRTYTTSPTARTTS